MAGGGGVQEGKVRGVGNTCETVPGKQITWRGTCERRDCAGYPVTTPEELDACVEDRADEIVGALLGALHPRSSVYRPRPTEPKRK